MNRDMDTKLNELLKKKEQLEARKKAAEKRNAYKEEKKHTGRLIRMGKAVEEVLGRTIDEADVQCFPVVLKELEDQVLKRMEELKRRI